MKSILVVAAHPDDEALGCGGTIAKFATQGHEVQVAFLADGAGAREAGLRPSREVLDHRREAARRACAILGACPPLFFDFPDNQMDTVPLLYIVQAVESLVATHSPSMVITHHAGDVNIDHQRTHQSVITACRPQPGYPVQTLLFFETPSSTEWLPASSGIPFVPNWFVDITATLDRKRSALHAYEDEMRPWPHPRSLAAVEHLARWRGATVGLEAAEAFMMGRHRT
jgi:LmbE family N-acetylglucosaminyl deacetylase